MKSLLATFCFRAPAYLRRVTQLTFFRGRPIGLAILFVLAVALTLTIADNNVIAEALLQSPPAEPSPTSVPPTPVPAPPTPVPQPPPAEPPAPVEPTPTEIPPTEAPATETAQAEPTPTAAQPVIESVSPVSPIAPVSPPVLPAGNQPPPLAQPEPLPTRPLSDDIFFDEAEESAGEPNFILDQIELIDSVVVSTAYIWLCCGIGLFLFIPLFFLLLQIRGQIKIRRENKF